MSHRRKSKDLVKVEKASIRKMSAQPQPKLQNFSMGNFDVKVEDVTPDNIDSIVDHMVEGQLHTERILQGLCPNCGQPLPPPKNVKGKHIATCVVCGDSVEL